MDTFSSYSPGDSLVRAVSEITGDVIPQNETHPRMDVGEISTGEASPLYVSVASQADKISIIADQNSDTELFQKASDLHAEASKFAGKSETDSLYSGVELKHEVASKYYSLRASGKSFPEARLIASDFGTFLSEQEKVMIE